MRDNGSLIGRSGRPGIEQTRWRKRTRGHLSAVAIDLYDAARNGHIGAMISFLSRRWIQVAATLLPAAMMFVPTLTYSHDRLARSDDGAHFRPGKNIERPHEQHSWAAVSPLSPSHAVREETRDGRVVVAARATTDSPVGPPTVPRAPPAR